MSRAPIGVMVLIAVVLGTAGLVHALDCHGRIVSMGASPWEVQEICGAPTQLHDTIEIVLRSAYDPQGRVAEHLPIGVSKQVWTYNFGSSRLIYMLTFLDGTLVKIDTGGYGH